MTMSVESPGDVFEEIGHKNISSSVTVLSISKIRIPPDSDTAPFEMRPGRLEFDEACAVY